ncbi:uncharacterized protein LOC110847232 [Folsomia candida]|uniref:uncharacterized protein LOC110847232 n=1 Tax=Folsomia candida TaxID=158441 RepID=UPI000B8FBCCE|nr:uncharacterized protein LOC110847232 [Folsomia candida]
MAKIMNQCSVRMMITLVIAAFLTSQVLVTVSARYLPTRSQDDRLEKLRELLRDLLEGDLERRPATSGVDYEMMAQQGRPPVYKRSTNAYTDLDAAAAAGKVGPNFLHRIVPNLRKSLD